MHNVQKLKIYQTIMENQVKSLQNLQKKKRKNYGIYYKLR